MGVINIEIYKINVIIAIYKLSTSVGFLFRHF